MSGSDTRRNYKKIRRGYLKQVRQDTELLTLKGIPAGLISESVRLDEVFIPIELRPNRPRTDYPLTERELEQYRELRQVGKLSAAQERAIVQAEHNWEHILKENDRIGIADFWERLSAEQPAAVIQGAPGMGKSTLMERLTLYMARRSLGVADDDIPGHERIEPLIPILLRLGEYALACEEIHGLGLKQHLTNVLAKFDIAGLDTFVVEKCLETGHCLVLFDGLDEVSKPEVREQVQIAIKEFIRVYRNTPKESNRFIITSRIAGYDQDAFPRYAHFTVAELTSKQINDFLPRWCRANVRRSLRGSISDANGEDNEVISREADQRVVDLRKAIQSHEAVQELAENPLLLTLLAVMQQNSIVLPRQRVELYSVVTTTLLENRNIAKNLIPIPEGEAIKRLGPLAFEMQEQESFALESDVIASLRKTIGQAGGSPEEIAQEATTFLSRIRERGGLFVQRTGDYFSFLHRTFQEYFAARYVLNEIELDAVTWIPKFVKMARRSDDLWREPFLLAVGYQSKANKKVANDLLKALLPSSPTSLDDSQDEQEHDVLLAAECVIEAKSMSIDAMLEKQIAGQLLQCYEVAQRKQVFKLCTEIEKMMRRWLLSLPREAYRPPLLETLCEAIIDITQSRRQVATLTMLTMIAQELGACPPIVFDRLIPPLLSLTGLPAAGDYQPSAAVQMSTDLNVADLALTALSYLGRKGPPGSLLTTVREYFTNNLDHLRILARYSLECGTLITLAIVPLAESNYLRYETEIGQWLKLRDAHKTGRASEREIDTCLSIHNNLLDCTEEVAYPTTLHLLKMLQSSADHPDQSWQATWKDYLLNLLSSGSYISYQEAILLWTSLFPSEEAQSPIASQLARHYDSDGAPVQRYAERFLATLSVDLRDLRYLRDLRDLRDLRYLSYLRNKLLTQENARKAIDRLSPARLASMQQTEQVDLLTVLLGRLLQIVETNEVGYSVEREIQQIVHFVYPGFLSSGDEEIDGVVLDILGYLPARSVNEIRFVLQLAEDGADEKVQQAFASSLSYATPLRNDDWRALEVGKTSKVKVVREAIEECLGRRKAEISAYQ